MEEGDDRELLHQQTVLARFGELALKSDDLDEILTEACRLVGEALGTDLAKIMELKEDGETLFVRAGVGWKPGVVGEATVNGFRRDLGSPCPEDLRADDLPRHREGEPVQLSALLSRQRRAGGGQRPDHGRRRQATL